MWPQLIVLLALVLSHIVWPFHQDILAGDNRGTASSYNSSWTPEKLYEWWQIPAIPDRFQVRIYGTYLQNPDKQESTKTINSEMGVMKSYMCGIDEIDATYPKTGKTTFLTMANPHYSCSLERIKSERWVARALKIRKDNDTTNVVNNLCDRILRNHWGMNIGVHRRLIEPGVSLKQLPNEIWNNEEVEVLDVTFPLLPEKEKNPYQPANTPDHARVYISPERSYWPVRIDYTLDYKYEGVPFHREITVAFEDWQEIDGQVVPLRNKTWDHGAPTVKYFPSGDCLMDVSNWDAPFPMEQAYLTYYGLPEPEGISRGMSWWWWVVIVALGLGVFFFWRKLRA